MACLHWNPENNSKYEEHLQAMEESLVKLRLSELARIRSKAQEKEKMQPSNGTIQKDGRYYLVRLEMEREKIKSFIDTAEQDSRLSQVPEEALGKIRNAIGKAQLLLSKRFKQFSELCRDNIENDPDKKETKPSDLLGYWEMMFIQIEDVYALFDDIAKSRANNWLCVDNLDGPKSPSPKALTPKTKRKSAGNKSPRAKTLDDEKVKREARTRLAAARKQAKLRQQQQEQKEGTSNIVSNENTSLNGSINPDISLNSSLNASNPNISINSSLSSSMELLNTDSPENDSPGQSDTSAETKENVSENISERPPDLTVEHVS